MDGHDHMHGKSPPSAGASATMGGHHAMMHMTFFWGKNAEILFDRWPGRDRLGMYILALVVVFLIALIVEWISHLSILWQPPSQPKSAVAGLLQTGLFAVRVGLAYLVMLAVMSFNVGVLIVAIAGHAVGFFIFGSRAFRNPAPAGYIKGTDLPPVNC